MEFITKCLSRALTYSYILMVVSLLGLQAGIFPSVANQWLFSASVWIMLVLAIICLPYLLVLWIRGAEMDRISLVGLFALIPVLGVYLWVGGDNFSRASTKVTQSDDLSFGVTDKYIADGDYYGVREIAPSIIQSSIEEVNLLIKQYASDLAWEELSAPEARTMIYRTQTPALKFDYVIILSLSNFSEATRVDVRVIAVDQDNDFGYGYRMVEKLNQYLGTNTTRG